MRALIATAVLIGFLALRAAQAEEPRSLSNPPAGNATLTFFVTDFGINQYKAGQVLKTGDDFSNAKSSVFPTLPSDAQFSIVMPPHKELRTMSDAEVTKQIFGALKTKVESGITGGRTTFELQIIEHIGTITYVSKGHQEAVNRFGKCAYEAIDMLHDYLYARGYQDQKFRGIFGSNGTKVFSENAAVWKGYMHDASFFDGRAFKTPMIETIKALGEKNVRIFNTAGDYPAPNNPAHSIGNHDVVKDLKSMFPGLTVGWVDPTDRIDFVGFGHLAAMQSDVSQRFLVKFWTGDSYTPSTRMSSAQLLPRVPVAGTFPGVAKSVGQESGVSMKTEIGLGSVSQDESGKTQKILKKALKDRPTKGTLSWPIGGGRHNE